MRVPGQGVVTETQEPGAGELKSMKIELLWRHGRRLRKAVHSKRIHAGSMRVPGQGVVTKTQEPGAEELKKGCGEPFADAGGARPFKREHTVGRNHTAGAEKQLKNSHSGGGNQWIQARIQTFLGQFRLSRCDEEARTPSSKYNTINRSWGAQS